MADDAGDEAKRKALEREAKKAEVRKRLEEAGKAGKKAKKGFLTPERKKKLRKLLMVKAAEDLKRQQLQKEQERQKVLAERTIPLPEVDSVDDKGKLEKIYNELFERVKALESEKYDINAIVSAKENEINCLNIEVNDLRGKYAKPALKKVSKYDNKFKKMLGGEGAEGKAPKADFRSNLKVVKKTENVIDDVIAKKKKDDKPEWSKKGGEKKEEEAAPPPKKEEKVEEPVADEEEVSEAPEASEAEEEEEEE
ncbi:unc-27 [Pristionchus pacificus]|uniref:Unc-27 n=1 Tax=Pristionchus pacificus TaxID=54126 RepID=A0A8R1YQT4_PRIPA|nr:unc-27 [Pristionchus pacificus]|eukprot:PDM66256.1 unc-27 [Pristionchus pacificus]